jgi:nicotinate-nucleotide adenylyltransferase
MSERIALLGGSFNPIHLGHLIIARSIAEKLQLDRVIWLPSASPPHKAPTALAPTADRAEMVKLAIADEPLFDYDDHDQKQAGPTYTVNTVAHFREVLGPEAIIHWIIGADTVAELANWYRVRALVASCRILIAQRPGWDRINFDALRTRLGDEQIASIQDGVVDTPRIDISATDIRRRVRAGRSIRYLVPESVRAHINDRGLYR